MEPGPTGASFSGRCADGACTLGLEPFPGIGLFRVSCVKFGSSGFSYTPSRFRRRPNRNAVFYFCSLLQNRNVQNCLCGRKWLPLIRRAYGQAGRAGRMFSLPYLYAAVVAGQPATQQVLLQLASDRRRPHLCVVFSCARSG